MEELEEDRLIWSLTRACSNNGKADLFAALG